MTDRITSNRPDMILMKNGSIEVSKHRDLAEAIQRATNEGPGTYTIIQPDITVEVVDDQDS